MSRTGLLKRMSAGHAAMAAIVELRCQATRRTPDRDPLKPRPPMELSPVDITVVTHNSQRWIDKFGESLCALDYPKKLLTVRFIDHASTDSTVDRLHAVIVKLRAEGAGAELVERPNRGFGAGHNTGIALGKAPFCLVTNVDVVFERDALSNVVATALTDDSRVAAWELRQKPYEHPKYYDPVSGLTNWNSHSCILLRRSALEETGSYDENLFMYGEDVELSYRLRRSGFLLRYCPHATVWHFAYSHAQQIKPLQYTGTVFANLYIRLKYANAYHVLAVPFLVLRALLAPSPFQGSRKAMMQSLKRFVRVAPRAVSARRRSAARFPFRGWDYDYIRDGAFVELKPLPSPAPLVSIITRTYEGRALYLRQALLSVAHQRYPSIEHIVVEDGGDTHRDLVNQVNRVTGGTIRFIPQDKRGRSATGNAGLAAAQGLYCLFLDDDDLLYADHVEVLVDALRTNPGAVASYSLSWEIFTDDRELSRGSYVEFTHSVPVFLRQTFDFETLLHHNYMAIQSVLFERRLFEERGGLEEELNVLEDWNLWLRYARDHRFVHVPRVTSTFRTPADPREGRRRLNILCDAGAQALVRTGGGPRTTA